MNRTEHLLACLAEECAEVQHAVAKAMRFGLDDGYPGADSTNAQDIAREFADVLAVVEMLEEAGALERQTDAHAIERKKARVSEYMAYAEQCGTLTPNDEAHRKDAAGGLSGGADCSAAT